MNQDDICMQCGHTRSLHNQDGCNAYIMSDYPETPIPCGCIVDCYQGKIIKKVN